MPNNRIAPCKCGYLEAQANHPDSPIRFDPQLNEYHFIHHTSESREAKMMIYQSISDVADVHVTVYPTDRVGISFQGKAVKKHAGQQTGSRQDRDHVCVDE